MRHILLLLLTGMTLSVAAQNQPKVSSGTILRLENFKSQHVSPRNIDIWMPEGYSASKKYAVIYMHDGQMLFDTAQAWNRQEWKVDETLSQLNREQKTVECIVVGIWNTGADRISEYFPTKIYNLLEEKMAGNLSSKYFNGMSARGDQYLKFITQELKPFVDKNYFTLPDREHTFMMGSSMGGLISIYAICEYPAIFKGVACLSTAWLSQIEPGYEIPAATFAYLKDNLPSPSDHLIYMDYGTGESDKSYETTQAFVDLIAKGKGYNAANYSSKTYEKEEHNEIAWSRRLNVPMAFLIPRNSK
jgi:predicted alpha/beta superfamily hydrolase